MIPRVANIKCQNTWPKLVGLVFEQGRHFVSHAFFFLYIYLTSSLISPISSLLIFKERELVTLRTLLPSSC